MNRGSLGVANHTPKRPSTISTESKPNGASLDPLFSSWMPGKLSGCRQWLEVRKEFDGYGAEHEALASIQTT